MKTSLIIIQDKIIIIRLFYRSVTFKITADTIIKKVDTNPKKSYTTDNFEKDSKSYNSSNIPASNNKESTKIHLFNDQMILKECNLLEYKSLTPNSVTINLIGNNSKSVSIVCMKDVNNFEDVMKKIISNLQLKETPYN